MGTLIIASFASLGWYWGYVVHNESRKGVFPANYITLKDYVLEKQGVMENIIPKEKPLVIETVEKLREYGDILKMLYLNRDQKFLNLVGFMYELMEYRQKIIYDDVTPELIHTITAQITYWNRVLKLDVTLRNERGDRIEEDELTVMEIYEKGFRNENSQNYSDIYNLFVNFKHGVLEVFDQCDAILSLYDATTDNFISESMQISLNEKGMPVDLAKDVEYDAFFTDLDDKDMNSKLFLVCQLVRIGAMHPKSIRVRDQNDLKSVLSRHKDPKTFGLRRPYGVAVYDLKNTLTEKIDNNDVPMHVVSYDNESLYSTIKKAIKQSAEKKGASESVWVSLKLLRGYHKDLRRTHPLMIKQSTKIVGKFGFPEVIVPGDDRNDMFISIASAELDKTKKGKQKNLQLLATVVGAKGNDVSNGINMGKNEHVATYSSVVYHQENCPVWMETFKLGVTPENFKNLHIIFRFRNRHTGEVKDKDSRIFAFSYLKLSNPDSTVIADGRYDLVIYKTDKPMKLTSDVYLRNPSTLVEIINGKDVHFPNNDVQFTTKDFLSIHIRVCSTKLTQSAKVLGLLKWNASTSTLKSTTKILENFMDAEKPEVVKFLVAILDVIFKILSKSDQSGTLPYKALVFVLCTIEAEKFRGFKKVFDSFIENHFKETSVHLKLLIDIKKVLTSGEQGVPDTVNVLQQLLRLAIKSEKLHERTQKDSDGIRQQFITKLIDVLSAINNLMPIKSEFLLSSQMQILSSYAIYCKEILNVLNPHKLSDYVHEFLQNIPPDRLIEPKLICLRNIVESPLFLDVDGRNKIMADICRCVRLLLFNMKELGPCYSLLKTLFNKLQSRNVTEKEKLGPILNHVYNLVELVLRPIMSVVSKADPFSSVHLNYATLMIALFSLMEKDHFSTYFASFHDDEDLIDLLNEIYTTFLDLIRKPIYKSDWHIMLMTQNAIMLNVIRQCFTALTNYYLHDNEGRRFNYQLWNNYLQLSVAFVTQDVLHLEKYPFAKYRKILRRYQDMRLILGLQIASAWKKLGKFKINFIPGIVGPLLEVALLPNQDLRGAIIPIFFDMMCCEYTHNDENFNNVELEMIQKLDILIESGQGDKQYQEMFREIMTRLCNNNMTISPALSFPFVQTITLLIEKLLDYHTVHNTYESLHSRLHCTVNLLNFYKDIQKNEMYVRYVYKLRDLHLEAKSYIEAGYTLLLHAELLKWIDSKIRLHKVHGYDSIGLECKLKEKLYHEIIDYFDLGQNWEDAIGICKRLVVRYETEEFDYEKLSAILKRLAELYNKIVNEPIRPASVYYYVGCYGKGFPSFLSNKTFIYRGRPLEQIIDFQHRMQRIFPDAQVLSTLDLPEKSKMDSDKQYLQICKADPVCNMERFADTQASERIKRYYKTNHLQVFQFSRPFHKGKKETENEFATLWLKRTVLRTKYVLPGILQWFETASPEIIEIDPLEYAIESVQMKVMELKDVIERAKQNPKGNINNLGLQLNGILDAAVNGGIAQYAKVFFTLKYLTDYPEREASVNHLKELILYLTRVAEEGVEVHGDFVKTGAPTLQPLHDKITSNLVEFQGKVNEYHKPLYSVIKRKKESRTARRIASSKYLSHRPSIVLEKNPISLTPGDGNDILTKSKRSQSAGQLFDDLRNDLDSNKLSDSSSWYGYRRDTIADSRSNPGSRKSSPRQSLTNEDLLKNIIDYSSLKAKQDDFNQGLSGFDRLTTELRLSASSASDVDKDEMPILPPKNTSLQISDSSPGAIPAKPPRYRSTSRDGSSENYLSSSLTDSSHAGPLNVSPALPIKTVPGRHNTIDRKVSKDSFDDSNRSSTPVSDKRRDSLPQFKPPTVSSDESSTPKSETVV
ncbi:Dedicator of cytokinesis protein 1 [Trichoplax sp. H2]|nr:Dedicator of cytokinesis protein 1 [Trichoplax sp. H2]|eukprot:RDD41678.1 Dedicator of cytokinesis protein 1 [Trichoplax sp. H2]